MSAFGGLVLTTKGRNLQAKAQAGAQLNFTRIGVGDGELAGSSILELNALKHEVKTLNITKLKPLTGGKAAVGGILSNIGLVSGFYWRELGLFAQDPDIGEILYCYGNSGVNAEYIPADGGPDVLEKSIDIISIVGNAAIVTATIEQSLVFATAAELNDLSVVVAAKETPAGAQTKATAAETAAKTYADAIVAALVDTSPAALNTLNELAAALGDDPNFATTVLNQIAAKADASALTTHVADAAYQVAGGTATAITLTTATLTDGYAKTFIASANNSGVATTINTKPLYKPSTVIAPTLIAGKAYTVWYNLASNCFFIKASAEGTATVAQVLAGVPFSNETDTGLIGTMPNRAGDTAALASSIVGTTLKLRASAGYRDGVDDNVTITDPEFTAPNIALNKNVLGITGTFNNVKNIQRGTANLTLTGVNVTVTAVDMSKTELRFTYTPATTNSDIEKFYCRGELTTINNIHFSRGTSADPIVISWELIEYEQATVQRGLFTEPASSLSYSIPISPVNLSKSYVNISVSTTSGLTGYTYFNQMAISASLLSNSITINTPIENRNRMIAWQVIDFS